MRFATPYFLWLLLLTPLIGFFLVWAGSYRKRLLTRFATEKSLARGELLGNAVMSWVRIGLFLLAFVALVLALARPQWGYHERQVITQGVDMVIAIDTSASMMARDFPPNRLTRAKELLRNLIWEAKGDRVGVVAFAGNAAVMCPLTLDYKMAITSLKAVDVNTIARQGTDIGSAISAANGAFEVSGGSDRILVLLTDGEQLEQQDELNAAVAKAKAEGVKIFSIGLGGTAGVNIPTTRGPLRFEGKAVETKLDFETLTKISTETGGKAIRAEKMGASEIAEISAQLAKFRGTKQQDKTFRVYHERYPWFLAAGLLFLVAEALLRGVKRLGRDRRPVEASAIVLFAATALALGLPAGALAYPGETFVRSRDALQKYHAGEYDESRSTYERAAELDPQNPELMYNLGASASKAGKLDEAKESLGKVYDPQNPLLNVNARYGVATINHREIRKTIADNRQQWQEGLAQGKTDVKPAVEDAIKKLKQVAGEYQQAILQKPDDMDIKVNYELAKRDLNELEKMLEQHEQQQQQQQPEQPQENQEDEKENEKPGDEQEKGKDQEKQGEQGKEKDDGKQGKDDEKKDQSDQKPGEGKPDDQKNDKGKQDDQKPGDQDEGNKPEDKPGDKESEKPKPDPNGTPAPTPTPAPKGTPAPGDKGEGEPEQAGQGNQPVPAGEMSQNDVDRLLNTLPAEDQQALQRMMGTPTDQPDMKHEW